MEQGPLDRLRLTEARIAAMADGLRNVAALPDPVGEVLDGWTRPNGLEIQRVRVPLGVVAIIYENRPNVTSDAAGLCLKAGNAALLRGSGDALRSNLAVAGALREGFAKAGLPEDCLVLVDDPSHESATEVMRLTEYVDCLIPRGGPALIKSILENATVPVVIDGDGNCHVYVDESADLDEAVDIVVNAKTQRPSVCNAAESLVVHEAIADALLPRRGRRARCRRRRAGRRRGIAAAGPGDGRGDRAGLRERVPRAEDERRDRRLARRRDRPREPVRDRSHRGDPHA